jgi:hypothetical protein
VTYVKFVDGEGDVITDINTNLLPAVGEYVQFSWGPQASVTCVMCVYHQAGDWLLVTVAWDEPPRKAQHGDIFL